MSNPIFKDTELDPIVITASIADSETDSDIVETRGYALIGLIIPDNFDGTEFSFHIAVEKTYDTMNHVFNIDGTEFKVKAAASTYVTIAPTFMPAIRWIQLVSDAAQESGEAQIKLVLREY